MKILIYSFILFSFQAYSVPNSEEELHQKICNSFNKNDDLDRMKQKINTMIKNQTNHIWKIKNRHLMGEALNTCEPVKTSKAFVLSFSGTGSFNPRTNSLLGKLVQCNSFQNLSEKLQRRAFKTIFDRLAVKRSAYIKWSGVDKGIMSKLISDDQLNAHAKNFDFASFPSEESELIADPQNISLTSLSRISDEISRSVSGSPQGIINAKKCLVKYALKSKELGIHPKLIIISHSSGGRSTVKFLSKMKKNKIEADLVLTIDPVKEAHHAIQEVASQYAGVLGDMIINPMEGRKKPVRVWSRSQPSSLYKTNSKKWVNFYQTDDSKGMNMSPTFGIYGSPIKGAVNHKIEKMGASGHGKICYAEKTISIMKRNILELFN